jgi:hypothetical protein
MEARRETGSPPHFSMIVHDLPKKNKKITLAEVRELMKDRPKKFGEAESGFEKKGTGEEKCAECVHFFTGKKAEKNTCELVRPLDDSSIPPEAWCAAFSENGTDYPNLKEK